VSAKTDGDGYGIFLDGRPVRTPAKSKLILPTRTLALAVADEWDAQADQIKPDTMPLTRTANSAIDKVAIQKTEVADNLAAYGDSDLLCYRAESPAELVARQNAAWDPVLDWAAQELGARLCPRIGVIHKPQLQDATAQLTARVHALSVFELAGFHDLVALTGSLILGFATIRRFRALEEIWLASRVDELWQIEQWGQDDEAQAQETIRRKSFFDAEKFFQLSRIKA